MTVRVSGTRVGALERDREGGVRFVPEPAWLGGEQRPPLGLSFLQTPRPPVVRGWLPSWFENLLPEPRSALRRWICQQRGLRERDSPAILAAVGRDLPGAVEVAGELAAASSRVAPELPEEGEVRFSLAGVQLKMSMLLSGDRFCFPARGEAGRWIVKIPGDAYADLPAVEAHTMRWAQAAGLPTPVFRVLPIEALHGVDPARLGRFTQAFAIERFDRTAHGRVHQEDFAQALGVLPWDKYGGERVGVSYDGLARLVRDACGADGQGDFIARLAFVLASGNDDAHLKNWSFQWGHDHRPRLSPCYDLVTTAAWWDLQRAAARTLALSLGKVRRFSEVDRGCVRKFAARAGAAGGEERFLAALVRARETWPSVADSAPAPMRRAVEWLWRSVPVLREVGPLPAAR